jgi:hypothetical protein
MKSDRRAVWWLSAALLGLSWWVGSLLRGKLGPKAPEYTKGIALQVPIIFVTAHGAVLAREVLAAAGGDTVLFKPIDFVELMRALIDCHLKRGNEARRMK